MEETEGQVEAGVGTAIGKRSISSKLMFVLVSDNTMPIKNPDLPLLGWNAVPCTMGFFMFLHSQNVCHYGVGTPKSQCSWTEDKARGNFLKELEIVTSEIIESKWSGGKETSFEILGWTFTEMPDVVLRVLYLYSLYLYIICGAPFLGLPHQQVTSEKDREADRDRERDTQRNSYTNRQRKKSRTG